MKEGIQRTEEWIEKSIANIEEQLGAAIASRDMYLRRIDELTEYLEGYKEAREIFLTYRVGTETRERFKRMGIDRFDPPIDK
jgi:predicted metal-dependent phosphoesterase TrpH